MLFLKFLLISFRCESIKEYTTLPVDVEGKFTLIFSFSLCLHFSYRLSSWVHGKRSSSREWLTRNIRGNTANSKGQRCKFSFAKTFILFPCKNWLIFWLGWGWLPWLSFIYQPSLSPVMITWWNSDWKVFGAICFQSHFLKYFRECAASSLRLRTCSTKAHSSAMGIVIVWKCGYIETSMTWEWA